MAKEPRCPLLDGGVCLKDECAWWNGETQECYVRSLAYWLRIWAHDQYQKRNNSV